MSPQHQRLLEKAFLHTPVTSHSTTQGTRAHIGSLPRQAPAVEQRMHAAWRRMIVYSARRHPCAAPSSHAQGDGRYSRRVDARTRVGDAHDQRRLAVVARLRTVEALQATRVEEGACVR